MTRAGVLTSLLFASVAASLLAAPAPEVEPREVLEKMRQAQLRLRSLEAGMEQVTTYPQLGIEDPPERGHFYLERGRGGAVRVRIEIVEPERRVLTMVGREYLLYQPKIRQAIRGELRGGDAKAVFAGILTGSVDAGLALERDYAVLAAPPENGESELGGAPVVELRFSVIAGKDAYCRRIDLWVDTRTFLPVRQSCHEANRNVITFTLTEPALDRELDDALFSLRPPPGSTVLEND